jgi:hypothetical protein
MNGKGPAVLRGLAFARCYALRIFAISCVVVVPCFWHAQIEAGDLGSHVYNAWIAQLIHQGRAPGLYLASLWHNVLFDWMLAGAARVVGFGAAQRIVVPLAVLIFFWGAFALLGALSGREAWFLTPCLAMLVYGYCFNMGFFNYYLSIGLACFSLAIFLGGMRGDKIAALFFLPIIYLAHPVGFLFVVGTMVYLAAKEWLPGWWKLAAPATVVAGISALHWALATGVSFDVDWEKAGPFYVLNGSDQLVLYGSQYSSLARLLVLFGVICVLVDAILRRREGWEASKPFALPLELYAVAFVVTALLPENVRTVQANGWMGLLVSRLTIVSALFGLGVLGCLQPRKWQLAGFLILAGGFFVFLYDDTAYLNQIERSAEELLWHVPYGTRMVADLSTLPDSRIEFVGHLAERVCVGHCFAYFNYEAPSRQFRVRAVPGSPMALDSYAKYEEMVKPTYVFQEKDLPLVLLYQCDEKDLTQLCLRPLAAGQTEEGSGTERQNGGEGDAK